MSRKNLLFISLEDLNDWIEPLAGHPQAYTPNLNRLAKMGLCFDNAYAAAPACSPSRTATLFSRFPWETGIYGNRHAWYQAFDYGQHQSIIGQLHQGGLTTYGAGKIFHAIYKSRSSVQKIDAGDWTAYFAGDMTKHPAISQTVRSGDLGAMSDFGVDVSGEASFDDVNTDWMIDKIVPGAEGHVWAMGVFRPHLPFIVPQEYFDLIPENVALPPGLGAGLFDPGNTGAVKGLPEAGKIMSKKTSKTGKVLGKHKEYNQFLRSYLASIAYADAKLGLILDRLETCGLMDNTFIVLWSDHGWQLGEKLAFRKFTLWERALRVPLFVAGPGIRHGRVTDPVSLVDVAPTILSLMGLPANPHYSGQDLSPAIFQTGPLARPYAPSVWGVGVDKKQQLAYSVRTRQHRYIRYWNGDEELYDHSKDPFEHENLIKTGWFAKKPPRDLVEPLANTVLQIAGKALPANQFDNLEEGDGDD